MTIPTVETELTSNWKREPTTTELFLWLAVAGMLFAATLITFHGWRSPVLIFGDNAAYLEVATAIRHWDFHGVDIQHFMG